nr:Wzy polymerase domain-containing protein [Atopomonas sediminilitoris]
MIIVRVLAVCFALLAWLLPITSLPWLSFSKEVSVFLSIFAVAVLLGLQQIRLQATLFAFWPWLMLLSVLVYYAFGVILYFDDVIVFCLYILLFYCCYVFAFSVQKREVDILLLGSSVLVVAGVLSFGVVCWQWLNLGDVLWVNAGPSSGRLFANFGQPNNLATFFLLSLLSTVLLYWRGRLTAVLFAILTIAFFWGVALTQSRTAGLSVLVVACWWFLKGRSVVFPGRHKQVIAAVICFFIMFFGGGQLVGGEEVVAHYSSHERLPAWWQMLGGLSFWGYGWGQVGLAQAEIVLAQGYGTIFLMNAHNIVLDFLLWAGVVGAGLVVVFFAWFARGLWSPFSAQQWFYTAMLAVLFVHAFLELPLEYAYFLAVFAALLGGYDAIREVTARECSWWLVTPVLLIMLLVGALLTKEYVDVEQDARVMRFQLAGFQGAENDLFDYDTLLLDGLRDFLFVARLQVNEQMTEHDALRVSKVAQRYPYASVLKRSIEVLSYTHECEKMRSEERKLFFLHGLKSSQSCVE